MNEVMNESYNTINIYCTIRGKSSNDNDDGKRLYFKTNV